MPVLKYTDENGGYHTCVIGQDDIDATLAEAFTTHKALEVTNPETGERYKPCAYCNHDDIKHSNHFQCDMCDKGMCDDCYDNLTEHDGHYHRPYESDEWSDERQPEYVCDECIGEYQYKS
jgi:hypothetical protein